MQAHLAAFIQDQSERRELEEILRSCVHCGFCNAVCPTYQLLGDELDGPRGRIYLMKQAFEGGPITNLTQRHLDRCLTCRSCETACPSGVRYGPLIDAGRDLVEEKVGRRFVDKIIRKLLIQALSHRRRFSRFLAIARRLKPWLPKSMAGKIPPRTENIPGKPQSCHRRTMLLLPGCVQESLAPSIDATAAQILDRLGISLITLSEGGCCGALPYHLSDRDRTLAFARRNIDACRPYLEKGAEAVVATASACGLMAKDYGRLLKRDPGYAEAAEIFSMKVKDIGEILAGEDLSGFKVEQKRVAFHSPCTLQHGQRLGGLVETILRQAGCELTAVADSHLCCGSAGVYAFLQPELSRRLSANKTKALEAEEPDLIATANIGCLNHLQSLSRIRVVHWIELFH